MVSLGVRFLLILLCALSIYVPKLEAQLYGASFSDSTWTVTAGPFACSLKHPIPGYGVASFVQKSKQPPSFMLQQDKLPFAAGAVVLAAVPPPWRADIGQRELLQLRVTAGPVVIKGEQSTTLLMELAKGMRLVFTGARADNSEQLLHIALEPKQFAESYPRYQACIAKLIPHSFTELARSLLTYDAQATELSVQTKAELDKLVRYVKADPKVLGLLIDAHADQRADEDAALDASRQQAQWVAEYLLAQGIAAEQVATRWHGAKFPLATNTNEVGRAKNRRVIVRMETAATRLAAEQKRAALKAAAAAQNASSSVAASLSSTLERLVNMVEAQDLNSGQVPEIGAQELR